MFLQPDEGRKQSSFRSDIDPSPCSHTWTIKPRWLLNPFRLRLFHFSPPEHLISATTTAPSYWKRWNTEWRGKMSNWAVFFIFNNMRDEIGRGSGFGKKERRLGAWSDALPHLRHDDKSAVWKISTGTPRTSHLQLKMEHLSCGFFMLLQNPPFEIECRAHPISALFSRDNFECRWTETCLCRLPRQIINKLTHYSVSNHWISPVKTSCRWPMWKKCFCRKQNTINLF